MDKKVFFKLNGFKIWNGGVNYVNQLKVNLKKEDIDLVIIINDFDYLAINALSKNLIDFQKIKTNPFFNKINLFFLRLGLSFTNLDVNSKDNILIYHGLIPLSFLSKKFTLIYWLPDILHNIYPSNLSKWNYISRHLFTIINLWFCDKLLLSSYSVKNELKLFYTFKKNIIVYQFSSFAKYIKDPKLEFDKPIVLLPHEFWTHKRQELIVELANNNKEFLFVLTGNNRISKKNSSYDLFVCESRKQKYDNILNLGIVSWDYLLKLFNHSEYIANISDYEGWNTSVEMAKSLNKKLILSEIDVHKEQTENYSNVVWFSPTLKIPKSKGILFYDYEKEFKIRIKSLCIELYQ
jgi:hypothetical protein